jgi:hypothetical protein
VRVGDTVRRPTGPWTPAVHALLTHLADRVPHIPRVLGNDRQGREVLTYLPGHVIDLDHEVLTEARLSALVGWTRGFHEAVVDFVHSGPWRYFPIEGATLVGHNDIAPYNACFDGDELAGVFDWDLAGPTTPALELAQLAWSGVPLYRPRPADEAARRLDLLATSYGGPSAREVLDAVVRLKEIGVAGIRAWIAAGDPAGAAQAAVGEPERTERALRLLLDRRPAIEEELP